MLGLAKMQKSLKEYDGLCLIMKDIDVCIKKETGKWEKWAAMKWRREKMILLQMISERKGKECEWSTGHN